jgi:hypothetical protein
MGRTNFKCKTNKRKSSKSNRSNRSKSSKSHRNSADLVDLIDVSEILTDNSRSINRIYGKNKNDAEYFEPAYASQFDPQMIDIDGNQPPSALNDTYATTNHNRLVDLERSIAYGEGWSQYDQNGSMTYGITPENQLIHNNMVPNYKLRTGYGSNDLKNMSEAIFKNELFTGKLPLFQQKSEHKENKPLFAPDVNAVTQYGTQIYDESVRDRYNISQFRNGEKPFESVQVTPGLGIGYHENGTHGFHSMYRAYNRTIDELRVKPKITYEGQMIESGLRGQNRPVQAKVMQYRPDTFKHNTDEDMLPTSGPNSGIKVRDNFIMKETDRSTQNIEYTGAPHVKEHAVQQNMPDDMKPQHKESTKSNFVMPKPMQKFAASQVMYNPNTKSYYLSPGVREQTIVNEHTGNIANTGIYTNLSDNARTTMKEATIRNHNPSNLAPNNMQGVVHSIDNIAKPTLKSIISEQSLNPNGPIMNTVMRTYNNDNVRETIKQTTLEPIAPANIGNSVNIYASIEDSAKPTLRQETVQLPYNTNLTPVNQAQRTPNFTDNARPTLKQDTVQLPYNTNLTPVNQAQRTPNFTDIAKPTLKQDTVQLTYNSNLTPINQAQCAPNFTDIAKPTIKQDTVQLPYNTNLTPVNQAQRTPNFTDTARSTIKQETVQIQYNTNITPIDQAQRTPNYTDIARPTLRQETVQIPYNTNLTPIDQAQRAPNFTDTARSTMKEDTVQIPYNTNITPIDQSQRTPNYTDIARSTLRQETVQIPYNTNITPIDQAQRTPNYTDVARPTLKQETVQIQYNTNLTPVNQEQRAPNYTDIARPTLRQETVQIPYNTNVTPVNQSQRTPNYTDIARPTLKETTIQIPYNTNITAVDQAQRAPNYTDIARPTLRQETVQIPYNTNVTPVNQSQRAPNYTDIARPTLKETTVQIPYNTNVTGETRHVVHNTDPLRSTIKETTVSIPYNTNIGTETKQISHLQDIAKTTTKETLVDNTSNNGIIDMRGQAIRAVNTNDYARPTIKETTVHIPYNTNVTGQTQSAANTFDRTPLKTTDRETYVVNNHVAPLGSEIDGHGYLTMNVNAPTTLRQQTSEKVYIGHAYDTNHKHRPYSDAYNARVTDKREQVLAYRPPTKSSVNMGPDVTNYHASLKDDTIATTAPALHLGCTFNNDLPRMLPQTSLKSTPTTSSSRFIDPILLQQLQSNPYNIDILN